MELEEISAEAAEVTEVPETTEVLTEQEVTPESVTEEVSEPDPSDIIKQLPPRKKTAEERISELTRLRREAERDAEYWKQKATVTTAPTPTPASTDSSRPRLENFDTTESYEDALLEWHGRQSYERTQQERQKERESEAIRHFNAKADKLREAYDDFDEVVQAPVFTKAMRSVLLTSEHGPVMAYYLGRPENIKVAEKIASLPAEMQPYEIGKLETQLLLAQKTKKVPSAPPPITPVGANAATPVNEDNLSDDEWYALEKKRHLERIQKRSSGG